MRKIKLVFSMICVSAIMLYATIPVATMAIDDADLSIFKDDLNTNVETENILIVKNNDSDCEYKWTIREHDLECESSDGEINFTMNVQNETLYIDGENFIFTSKTLPDLTDDENSAIIEWFFSNKDYRQVVFSDNVKVIETYAMTPFFSGVESIDFGNSLEKIGYGSFSFLHFVESLKLPASLKVIDEGVFENCKKLKEVTILSKNLDLSNTNIGNINGDKIEDLVIYGYSGSTAEVYANENNFEFVDITPEILGTGQCGENVYWTLYSDGTLDLEGTGATYDYTLDHSVITEPEGWKHYEVSSEYGYPTWFDLDLDFWDFAITTINVGEGITRLGDLIFVTNLIYYAEEINLPDSLEEIGFFALSLDTNSYYEPNVINKFPENLRVIEDGAFYSMYFDDKIVLPESVEKIGSFAFNTSAKEYVIPQNVKEISPLAFGFTGNEDYVDNYPIYDEVNEEYLEQFFKFRWTAMYQKDISHVTDVFKADTSVTVYGYTDSTAETYANENNFEFVPLNEETTTTISAISTSTETTTTTVIENITTETSSETTSQNTASSTSGTTTAVSTTSKKSSAKEDSPKTGDKGIIGIGAVLLSASGMFCISKKRQ